MRARPATRLAIDLAALAAIAALYVAPPRAHAANPEQAAPLHPELCHPIAAARDRIDKTAGGQWIELTELQRAFLEGVFILDPNTPPGLPYGDKAALGRKTATGGWVAFWVDGDLACEPMAVPMQLFDMLVDIGAGKVTHEGTEN